LCILTPFLYPCKVGNPRLLRSSSLSSRSSYCLDTFVPTAPSLFALHTPPSSPPNSSSFQTSTLALHSSSASSPAFHAACRCGDDTAINMLSSPIGTLPSRWIIEIAVRPCLLRMSLATVKRVFKAFGTYEVYCSSLTGLPLKLSRVVPRM